MKLKICLNKNLEAVLYEKNLKMGLAVVLVLTIGIIAVGCGSKDEKAKSSDIEIELPWENGGKAPEEYNWEEFNKLTGPQQIKFQNSFEKYEDFEKWIEKARTPKQ